MVADYIKKTYAGWLGKVIGIRMGAPIEGWTKEKIELIYGKTMRDYVVDYQDFAADDDSNGPIFFVRGLEHYKNLTAKDMGMTCLNYIPKEHGFFWWGNELSTEHTAFKNLFAGIKAPESGSAKRNGMEMAEQIGGQIFIDCFGFVAPGNPELACQLAEASARVTHDYDGVAGARFVAACISLAYTESNILSIMKQALTYIDRERNYYKVVTEMIQFYEEGKSKEEAFARLKETYWTDCYQGICHIVPNAGIMAIALLYGEGNFLDTMELVNLLGFDTDCNAGNVGAIMGVLCGVSESGESKNDAAIPDHLIHPIKDIMLASSVVGSLNISTLSENALLFSKIGYELAGETMPEPYRSYWYALEEKGERIAHFEFHQAIHGFRTKASYKNAEVNISNSKEQASEGSHSLKITINNLHPQNEVSVYQKTYYQPEDLHDARYQPCFSPIVFPGDEVRCSLYNVTGQKLKAYLYAYDSYHNQYLRFAEQDLTTNWCELSGKIPYMEDALIKETGVILVSEEETDTYFGEQVVVYLDQFITKSAANYRMNFRQIPMENYSLHSVEQYELSGFTHYRPDMAGIKKIENGLELTKGETIYTGDYYWRDYQCEVELQNLQGEMFEMLFRCQGNLRSYALRITGEEIVLLKYMEQKEMILDRVKVSTICAVNEQTIEENESDNVKQNPKSSTLSIHIVKDQFKAEFDGCTLMAQDSDYCYGMIGMRVSEDAKATLVSFAVNALSME